MERTSNDDKMLVKHFQMVQNQIDQLSKVQKDLLVNASREKHAYEIKTRSGVTTHDPLYPERHPNRIEQDSQRANDIGTTSKNKKKNKSKNGVESSEQARDPNSVSISDAEMESGNDKSDASDKEEIEEKSEKHIRST